MNGNLSPFAPATPSLPPFEEWAEKIREAKPEVSTEELRYHYDKLQSDSLWLNDEYQVHVDREPPHNFPDTAVWHLSIKRIDKQPIHDWRDLQEIKNILISPEAEAVELYPAESRLVDSSNQYHLWVFMDMKGKVFPRFPIGWNSRMTGTHAEASLINAVQRDREDKGG